MSDHEPARSERRRFMRRELWIVVALAVLLAIWLMVPKQQVRTQGGLVMSRPATGASAIVPVPAAVPTPGPAARPAGGAPP